MSIFQPKARLTIAPKRVAWVAGVAVALALAGCGDRSQRAYQEAQRAQAALDAGDLAEARRYIARALAQRDDQIDLILLDGRIKYRSGQMGAAYAAYNLALAIDPMNPEALQAVSQIGAASGADAEAASATDRILTLDPNNTQALMVKGVQLLGKRDTAGAMKIADQLLKSDPNSEPGTVLKARALGYAGQPKEALALLNDAVKRAGPTQMVVTALLESARDQGDAELMLQQFRALRDLVPKNVDLTIDEANVQYKRGQQAAARERGWALLTQNGGDPKAVQRLTDLWSEYDPRPLAPDQVATLGQEGAGAARLGVARFYLGQGDPRTAAAVLGDLPGGEAAGLRARIGAAGGDSGAVAAAERILATDRSNCDALAVRAEMAMRGGRPEDAVVAAQQIASECPDREDGPALIARAYLQKGNETGARRGFLDGIQARPLATAPVARYVAWLTGKGDLFGAADVARRLTQRAPAKVSGWRLLRAACERAKDAACVAEAAAGEAAARRSFAIDLPPGERRPNPLLGNSWQ